MDDDNKPRFEPDDALQSLAELRKQLEQQSAELAEAKAQILNDRARLELGGALDEAGIWAKGKALAVKTFLQAVQNLHIDESGQLVGSLGAMEAASPGALARAFLDDEANALFLPIESGTDDAGEESRGNHVITSKPPAAGRTAEGFGAPTGTAGNRARRREDDRLAR